MQQNVTLFCLAIVMLAGCSEKVGGSSGTTSGSGAKGDPAMKPGVTAPVMKGIKPVASPMPSIDKKGNYTITQRLPERYACSSDADCSESRFRPGKCCKTECPLSRVGGTRAWVEAVARMWRERCAGWHAKNRYSCTYPKCSPRGRPRAACVKGRCTVEYKPIR